MFIVYCLKSDVIVTFFLNNRIMRLQEIIFNLKERSLKVTFLHRNQHFLIYIWFVRQFVFLKLLKNANKILEQKKAFFLGNQTIDISSKQKRGLVRYKVYVVSIFDSLKVEGRELVLDTAKLLFIRPQSFQSRNLQIQFIAGDNSKQTERQFISLDN